MAQGQLFQSLHPYNGMTTPRSNCRFGVEERTLRISCSLVPTEVKVRALCINCVLKRRYTLVNNLDSPHCFCSLLFVPQYICFQCIAITWVPNTSKFLSAKNMSKSINLRQNSSSLLYVLPFEFSVLVKGADIHLIVQAGKQRVMLNFSHFLTLP